MVKVRSEEELKLIRESGHITSEALKKVLDNLKIGVTGLELDKLAENEIKKMGGESSFKTVEGYSHTICITFNEQVVHGLPTNREIMKGDIVSIDLGTVYKGWHSDSAWSVLMSGSVAQSISESERSKKEKFLRVGEEALWMGIKQAIEGNRVGDISSAIQQKVESGGYSVVRSLVGHGVGKSLHEEPEVPGYGKASKGLELQVGMTLAIEVIYTEGRYEVILDKDGWTISTRDGSLSGLFEMSVVVGRKEAEVITDWRSNLSHSGLTNGA